MMKDQQFRNSVINLFMARQNDGDNTTFKLPSYWLLEDDIRKFMCNAKRHIHWILEAGSHKSRGKVGCAFFEGVTYVRFSTKSGNQIYGTVLSPHPSDSFPFIKSFAPWSESCYDRLKDWVWENDEKLDEALKNYHHVCKETMLKCIYAWNSKEECFGDPKLSDDGLVIIFDFEYLRE